MTDHRAQPPQVITLPAEIDLSNSEQVGNELRAAFRPGASVVVADLTVTTFCDTSGARTLLVASKEASAAHIELRLARAGGQRAPDHAAARPGPRAEHLPDRGRGADHLTMVGAGREG